MTDSLGNLGLDLGVQGVEGTRRWYFARYPFEGS